jgi:hypothetical protein
MYRGDYQLIGSEMSFFTRKLETQLRCQQVPWSYLFKTEERKAELEAKAGTHFIPLLMTPGTRSESRHSLHPTADDTR